MFRRHDFIIRASGYVLTNFLPEESVDWPEDKILEFIEENIAEEFENLPPQIALDYMNLIATDLHRLINEWEHAKTQQ